MHAKYCYITFFLFLRFKFENNVSMACNNCLMLQIYLYKIYQYYI